MTAGLGRPGRVATSARGGRRALAVAGLMAALGSSACAARRPPPVDFSEASRSYRPAEYETVWGRWTRHTKLVRDVGTVIEYWATFKTWDFRQAYVELYAELYGLPDAEREALQKAQLEVSRAGIEFHLTVQSTDYKWNDLEKKESPWQVTLIDGAGTAIPATSIEVVKLPRLYEMRFFPVRTDFTRTYLVRFAPRGGEEGGRRFAGTASGRVTLRIAGPLGHADTVWESRP